MKKSIIAGLLTMVMSTLMIAEPLSAAERREGDGYNTPKEAAQAYIEAFAQNDLDGMLKTFAIETYVDHYDLAKMVDRINSWQPKLDLPIQANNEYARELAVIKREGVIAEGLTNQYLVYSMHSAGYDFDGTTIQLDDIGAANGEEVVEKLFADPIWVQEKVEYTAIYTPEEFEFTPENYFSEPNQNNINKSTASLGVDEIQDLVVAFTVGPYQGYQFLQTGAYDGKWYVTSTLPNLAIMLGFNVYSNGLAIEH